LISIIVLNALKMKYRKILHAILIILNIVSLYFIVDLFSYDEIIGYVLSEGKRSSDPRDLAYLLFVTSLSNLYFLAFIIMERAFEGKN
jgi:hypothetical protein